MVNENNILVNKNNYIFNEEVYKLDSLKKDIKKKRSGSFIILDEEIYIRIIEDNRKKNLINIIKKEIKEEFKSEDYLLHFDIDKKRKKGLVYAIKGGKRITPLIYNFKNIKVLPIQFLILKLLKKKINKKDFSALIEFNKTYYFIKSINGLLYENSIINNIDNIEKNIDIKGSFKYPFKMKNINLEENGNIV